MKTESLLRQAAQDYAKKQLGEEQFRKNKDAAKAIEEDFLAGANWTKLTENDLGDLAKIRDYFLERDKTTFEHSAYSILDSIIKINK